MTSDIDDDSNLRPEPQLKLVSVTRRFGSTEVLKETNLEVFAGEFIAIVGPSGSGKSTLLNILGLLDQPTSGQLFIDGLDTATLKEKEKNNLRSVLFGFVFQSSNLLPNESAASNAALGLQIQGKPRGYQTSRITELLETFGLLQRSQLNSKLLSGGERQRLALVRAVATSPVVLLADEPTGNLDSANSQIVIEDLRALNRAGTTIIVITHDLTVANAAQRVVTIQDGNLVSSECEGISSPSSNGPNHKISHSNSFSSLRRLFFTFCSSLSSLTNRPLISTLLVLAFVLGTGGITSAIGISESAAVQVSDRLTRAALDQIVFTVPDSLDKGLGVEEIYRRATALQGVVDAGLRVAVARNDAPVTRYAPTTVENDQQFSGSIIGVNKALLSVFDARVEPVSASGLLDLPVYSRSAILGAKAAESMGIAHAGPGVKIWVGGNALDVIGILSDVGRQAELDNAVLLSVDFASTLPQATSSWVVRTEPGYPAPLSEALPIAISPGNPAVVKTQTVADLRSLRLGVSSDLGTFIGLVSLILLVLASLSAGTSMYLSVHARREEVAMRRAIGQSRGSIRTLFILEGFIVGLFGGAAGAAVGTIVLVVVCAFQEWTPVLNPLSLWTALGVGALTGIISSVYPAFVAAQANPAQGIRG